MVRSLLVQQQVVGSFPVTLLSQLLQQVLVVPGIGVGRLRNPFAQATLDQRFGGLVSLVEIDSGNDRLEGGSENRQRDGVGRTGPADKSLAELEEPVESEFNADLGAGHPTDNCGLDPRHLAFGAVRKCPVQVVVND